MSLIINCKARTPKEISEVIGRFLDINGYLGNYTYDDGRTRKAISVGKPAKNCTVQGLEIICPKMPQIVNRNQYWYFYLIDREDRDQDLLYNVYQFISINIVNPRSVTYLPANRELNTYDQVVFCLNNGDINILARKIGIDTPSTLDQVMP
jgi:hypothetical protein